MKYLTDKRTLMFLLGTLGMTILTVFLLSALVIGPTGGPIFHSAFRG